MGLNYVVHAHLTLFYENLYRSLALEVCEK
jgi:hypothetical protein